MRAILVYIVGFVSLNSFAKTEPARMAESVCESIESNKYQSQCEQAIYKVHYFDPKALAVCANLKSDYDKKTCIEVIRNKEYTEGNIKDCLKTKKVRIQVCFLNNGLLKQASEDDTKSEAPVHH